MSYDIEHNGYTIRAVYVLGRLRYQIITPDGNPVERYFDTVAVAKAAIDSRVARAEAMAAQIANEALVREIAKEVTAARKLGRHDLYAHPLI